jgi:signal transduction histidine kinase
MTVTVPLRVLLLEDREADARLVLHELRQAGFEPAGKLVWDEPGFAAALEPAPDVIVADYCLQQFDALQALRLLRALGLDVPFLIVSGNIGEDTAVAALREGAADYLLKDRLARLGEAVRQALAQKRLRDDRRRFEEALRQSEQALQEANRRKDDFLSILAHELRNPLAPLRSGLEVLRLAGNDRAVAEQARAMMERQLVHLVRLVDDLLDVSRISRERIELRPERLDLASAVRSALETCEPLIRQNGLELTVRLPPEPVYLDADKTRLAQVISNLLNNAAKYTAPLGRVWLSVDREGGEAVLRVKDTGVGIPAPLLAEVFEMFTRVDRSPEKAQGGLGIGLSIVRRLVEMHGGSVEAHSEGPGRCSEFVVRLPAASPPGEREGTCDGEAPPPRARRRVLVVDDNKDAARSLAMMLRLMGHDPRTAHDGLEALDVAAAHRPDLILLDIGMPGLNGYETCRRLREQPWGKAAVIIALTGWSQEEDKCRAREAGFNSHTVKPIEPATLEKLLGNISPGEWS